MAEALPIGAPAAALPGVAVHSAAVTVVVAVAVVVAEAEAEAEAAAVSVAGVVAGAVAGAVAAATSGLGSCVRHTWGFSASFRCVNLLTAAWPMASVPPHVVHVVLTTLCSFLPVPGPPASSEMLRS